MPTLNYPVVFFWVLCPWAEKAMAPHSSTLPWKIPWTEDPGGLQSMGSLRVRHDWATSLSLFTFMQWRRKWQPTPVFLPGESQGRGLPSMGSHRVGHDWRDLAAAAAAELSWTPAPLALAGDFNSRWVLRLTAGPLGMWISLNKLSWRIIEYVEGPRCKPRSFIYHLSMFFST